MKTDEHVCADCGTTPAYYSNFKIYLCNKCFAKRLRKLLATIICIVLIYIILK